MQTNQINQIQLIQKQKQYQTHQYQISINDQFKKQNFTIFNQQKHSSQFDSKIDNVLEETINHAIPQENTNSIKPLPQPKSHNYRPQIDGMRTLAVSIVIIFHAWPSALSGGFIGVDIFFVISGYLISQIILKQTKKGKFSYIDFYSRRIKRIYPALLIVFFFVFITTYKIFGYNLQVQTYKKMSAATLFGANIQSMTKTKGYFDLSQKDNPLLHLWSLGVEQQFYIVWPIVIALIVNKFHKKGLQILVVFSIMSFIINVVTAFRFDSKIAFYFPLGRFWEMAIGGMLAYQKIRISNKIVANILSTCSIILIIIFSFAMDQKYTFPGFWALIPTLSATGIILAGQQSFINEKILSSKAFVAIGKISYPLYLWHWPLLVLSRKLYPFGSTSIFAGPPPAIILTFILSFLTYKLIQKPIRYRKSKLVVVALLIMMMIVGLLSLYLIFNLNSQIQADPHLYKPGPDDFIILNGKKIPNSSKNPNRQVPNRQKIKIADQQLIPFPLKNVDKSSKYYQDRQVKSLYSQIVINQGQQNQVFVIGDSHAGVLIYRYYQLYLESKINNVEENKHFPTVVVFMAPSSPFLPRIDYHDYSMDMIKKHKPDRVVFANLWTLYLQKNQNGLKDIQTYKNSVKQIVDLGVQVYVAKFHYSADRLHPYNMMDLFGPVEENIKPYKLSEFREQYKFVLYPFEKGIEEVGGKLYDFADNLCWQDICHILLPTGVPIMKDDNHYGKQYLKYWLSSVDFSVQF